MLETANVKTKPIQRNSADVATELTEIYCDNYAFEDAEDLATIYAKFYAVAEYLRVNPNNLDHLVPENIIREIRK